jgi:pimeloyl-ACP methyl ester carboxylesterase
MHAERSVPLAIGAALLAAGCAGVGASRKLDVGGHRLQIVCAGRGSPPVVMDSGLGDSHDTWEEVLPEVARFTRVCAYDRAGLGKSDPGPMPRTSRVIVSELRALLREAGVNGPYALVGHSFGGLNMSLFAASHPEEIAGLVLVDATHVDYPARERTLRSPTERFQIESAFGMARPAARSEYESMVESVAQVKAAGPLPDVPVIVISAEQSGSSEQLRVLWMDLQADLVRSAPHALQIVAEGSGHYIPFDRPDLVIEAIRRVVEDARR